MQELSNHQEAVGLLQELGCKEYEAKAFVALSRVPRATAKEISEISEVPRTRVYDAIRVLESKGLVEVQHSNPQEFRAVTIQEATDILRDDYDSRITTLQDQLTELDPADVESDPDVTHEVWSLSGQPAISSRTEHLVENADEEILFVAGHETALTEQLLENFRLAEERGVDVIIGSATEETKLSVADTLPEAEVFVSGLSWLNGESDDGTVISRLLLTDRSSILVSSLQEERHGTQSHEKAVFGHGFENGFVVIMRRLMATGLLEIEKSYN